MAKSTVGFLKCSQKFRENATTERYFPILDSLYDEIVVTRHLNDLPAYLSLKGLSNFSPRDVELVLSALYPRRRYACSRNGDFILCVRE